MASEDVEWVSDLLWSHGVVAIEEIPAPNDIVVLRTSLGEDRSVARTTMESLPDHLDWEFEDIDDRIVESWREHMRPFDVGESITIVPRWWTTDDNDTERRRVFIDPGATFGMGDHPTTRGCLIAMEGLDLRDRRVLDAGCGLGGTMIALARATGATCEGLTLSPSQARTANDAAAEAGLASRVRAAAGNYDAPPDGPFDLVVAIESLAHSAAPDRSVSALARVLAPGGRLLVVDDMPAASAVDAPDLERFKAGWQCPVLWGLEQYREAFARLGLEAAAAVDLTGACRPRTHAGIALLMAMNGLVRLVPSPSLRRVMDSHMGGLALERLLRDGRVRYQMLIARKPRTQVS